MESTGLDFTELKVPRDYYMRSVCLGMQVKETLGVRTS